MKYKRLLPKSIENHLMIKDFISTESFKEKKLYGKSLKDENQPTIVIKNKSGKLTDFLIGGTTLLIISEKAKVFFEENIEHSRIEFISVKVDNYEKDNKFWILNILERLPCFDWDKSDYILFDELGPKGNKVIRKITNMVFKDDIIQEKEIFYAEGVSSFVYVSEKFKQEILDSDLIGYRFI